ncbi:uncharacterized protein M421DRAFT_162645 [Didymella exigua CBS 183.55]|uniref:Uncharacterized protein n=1 Tax=Didymella exigua CBS 183.55 TaxID=1150837 RepID=A0A6A5RQX5_9PLEO|nr:uncharacterized protein M421DRAFT_162645 [Didymella exigua CBS 183.55]KAF1927887.1 hypothetical protein M421DRAFT_162645 [Didymella exigua CBS 183.55]
MWRVRVVSLISEPAICHIGILFHHVHHQHLNLPNLRARHRPGPSLPDHCHRDRELIGCKHEHRARLWRVVHLGVLDSNVVLGPGTLGEAFEHREKGLREDREDVASVSLADVEAVGVSVRDSVEGPIVVHEANAIIRHVVCRIYVIVGNGCGCFT